MSIIIAFVKLDTKSYKHLVCHDLSIDLCIYFATLDPRRLWDLVCHEFNVIFDNYLDVSFLVLQKSILS